ncbi:MAG: enoyl-CoA hydratase-related protein [Woeseiaceae bacterium]
MSDIVRYEAQESVATITLNRPESMNAFTTALRADLLEALELGGSDGRIRVIVLTGEGRCFSAGADLKDRPDRSVGEILQAEYRPVLEKIASLPKPVIAAVPGSAAGIGLSLALTCDLLIMADDAFLLSPFTTISLVPDGGLSWQLVRQLGYRRAFQLSVESERIPAPRCVELGLANRAVPAAELHAAAQEWARRLTGRAPLSIAATKQAMRHATDRDWASTYDVEAALQDRLVGCADNIEGIKAFFEKRKARFEGR